MRILEEALKKLPELEYDLGDMTEKEIAEAEKQLCKQHGFKVTLADVKTHFWRKDYEWLATFFYNVSLRTETSFPTEITCKEWRLQGENHEIFSDEFKKNFHNIRGEHAFYTIMFDNVDITLEAER